MNIFLAAPFTGKIDPVTQRIEQSYRSWLESIISKLVKSGHIVTNAHMREEWGAKLEPPEKAIRNDFSLVRDCDLVVAYLGNPPSDGVQMELGFAATFGKPIILICEAECSVPYLVDGLGALTQFSKLSFRDRDHLLEQLNEVIRTFQNAAKSH